MQLYVFLMRYAFPVVKQMEHQRLTRAFAEEYVQLCVFPSKCVEFYLFFYKMRTILCVLTGTPMSDTRLCC